MSRLRWPNSRHSLSDVSGTVHAGSSVYARVFDRAWLTGRPAWYPTHFVHAARAANHYSCPVTALLFEVNAADAVPRGHPQEDRRAEIATFLADKRARRNVGVSAFEGTLAPSPGDFRDPACWPDAQAWAGRALVVVSDPLEYRPERDPGGSRFGTADLNRLRKRLDDSFSPQPDHCTHVLFTSANLGTWGGSASTATDSLSEAWRTQFAPRGAATWCSACFWGGFLVFVGIASRNAPPSFADDCGQLPPHITGALSQLHRSRRGHQPQWIVGH